MAKLKTDSPLSRRIVLSFLQFIESVEPAPDVDLEGLEVAKECLAEVFKIDPSSIDNQPNTDSLIDIFHSLEANEQTETNPSLSWGRSSPNATGTSSTPSTVNAKSAELSCFKGDDWTGDPHALGLSKDELFGQFFGALENIRYFESMPDGSDDQVLLDRASQAFRDALENMQKSGCKAFDRKNLAETFKSQGNAAMQSKFYTEAIQLYTFAIAICPDTAVYYSNRAAAYTQMYRYEEAIADCLQAIEINPNYCKAYSRLGFVYYAQGKYRDAIDKGFMKALQLDPNNESLKENILVAEQKLREEQQRAGHEQYGGGSRTSIPFNANGLPPDIASMLRNMTGNVFQEERFQGGPEVHISADVPNYTDQSTGGSSTSMPFNLNGLPPNVADMLRNMNMTANIFLGERFQGGPEVHINTDGPSDPAPSFEGPRTTMPFNANVHPPDVTNMFRNMAANIFQGEHFQGGPEVHINTGAANNPGTRMGGNINDDIGEQMPVDLSGAFRSVMEVFPRAAAGAGPGGGAGAATPGSGEYNMDRTPGPT